MLMGYVCRVGITQRCTAGHNLAPKQRVAFTPTLSKPHQRVGEEARGGGQGVVTGYRGVVWVALPAGARRGGHRSGSILKVYCDDATGSTSLPYISVSSVNNASDV